MKNPVSTIFRKILGRTSPAASNMSKPFVLLTGATGMVGFRVLVLALKSGYRIRVAARNQEGFDRIAALAPVAPYIGQIEPVIVPDITVPGAYDEAVKGVEYIIHVASPLALPTITDFENEMIKPALQGTMSMLEAAHKTNGIKKIVITGSVSSVIPASKFMAGSGTGIFDERSRSPAPTGPYGNVLEAYGASKMIAFQATETFIKEEKPQFDVITVGPGYIVGRDDTVTKASNITKGTNGLAFGQLLGHPMPQPLGSLMAHLDDVAKVHVESLNPSIKGNHFFLLSSEGPYGVTWDSALDIIKRRYPKEVEEGVFKVDAGSPTTRVGADSSYVEKTFGIKLNSYEDAVIEVAEHYLELLGRK